MTQKTKQLEKTKDEKLIKRYKIKNDVVFKELFSKSGNEEFLKEFLSHLLNLDIVKIEIQKEVDLNLENVENKLGVIDIKATLNDNEIVDIEMQKQDNYDIIERTTKYSSNLIVSQLKKGDKYIALKPVIVVTIVDYEFLPYEEYISETKIVLKEHKEYEINKFQKYYYIELPKFRKKELEKGNKVMEWLALIDGEDKEKVEKAMESNKLVAKAKEEYEYLVGDERIQRLAELEEKAACELSSAKWAGYLDGKNDGMEAGIEVGKKAGMEAGKKAERISIAKSMLKKGIDVKTISEVTNLSVEDLKKLEK